MATRGAKFAAEVRQGTFSTRRDSEDFNFCASSVTVTESIPGMDSDVLVIFLFNSGNEGFCVLVNAGIIKAGEREAAP